jgi:hypothetical protein
MKDDKDPAAPPAPQTRPDPPDGAEPAAGTETLGDRVRAQRRHIEGLTGKDPLRAGIDD